MRRVDKLLATRQACEADLETYIRTVAPRRVLGDIHKQVISWWCRDGAKDNQLLLLPRAHQKSVLIAYRVAHAIVNNPAIQVLYVSSTSDLAEAQLFFIKQILESPVHQRLWPELIHPEEGKRERWSVSEIKVDHPIRQRETVRDPTVKAVGLKTTITGFHADIVVLDDVVEPNNAYTSTGREDVARMYSQLASIENPGAKEWVVGTRYHPKDLYNSLLSMVEIIYDINGEPVEEVPVYEIFQRVVEINGEYLWPRTQTAQGAYYGFNASVLARIRAKYLDKGQFYAQYYNDPSDPSTNNVDPNKIIYYDQAKVNFLNGYWYYKDKKLAIFAGMDFAFSLRRKADYTAIAVIGIDHDGFIYVLAIDRFKTDKISEYYEHLFTLYNKWGFRKARLEATAAQAAIIRDIKDNYLRKQGVPLLIDDYTPSANEGNKQERISSTLNPRYENGTIFHYRGGNCQLLEEEVIPSKPAHDDIKDALTAAIDIAKPPLKIQPRPKGNVIAMHSRFGGV